MRLFAKDKPQVKGQDTVTSTPAVPSSSTTSLASASSRPNRLVEDLPTVVEQEQAVKDLAGSAAKLRELVSEPTPPVVDTTAAKTELKSSSPDASHERWLQQQSQEWHKFQQQKIQRSWLKEKQRNWELRQPDKREVAGTLRERRRAAYERQRREKIRALEQQRAERDTGPNTFLANNRRKLYSRGRTTTLLPASPGDAAEETISTEELLRVLSQRRRLGMKSLLKEVVPRDQASADQTTL